jgi:hypothetical protein
MIRRSFTNCKFYTTIIIIARTMSKQLYLNVLGSQTSAVYSFMNWLLQKNFNLFKVVKPRRIIMSCETLKSFVPTVYAPMINQQFIFAFYSITLLAVFGEKY